MLALKENLIVERLKNLQLWRLLSVHHSGDWDTEVRDWAPEIYNIVSSIISLILSLLCLSLSLSTFNCPHRTHSAIARTPIITITALIAQ